MSASRSCLYIAFPHGVGENEFGGIQAALCPRLAKYVVVVQKARLHVVAVGIGLRAHEIDIEVDAQLARRAVVVGICKDAQRLRLAVCLVGVEMVGFIVVDVNVFVINNLVFSVEKLSQVGSHSNRVRV